MHYNIVLNQTHSLTDTHSLKIVEERVRSTLYLVPYSCKSQFRSSVSYYTETPTAKKSLCLSQISVVKHRGFKCHIKAIRRTVSDSLLASKDHNPFVSRVFRASNVTRETGRHTDVPSEWTM